MCTERSYILDSNLYKISTICSKLDISYTKNNLYRILRKEKQFIIVSNESIIYYIKNCLYYFK